MTDAEDIRRAIERTGLRGFARRAGCAPAAVQRLLARGAYPVRGPHGEAMRAAVAEVLAEAGPEPAAIPAVPVRYAATLRLLARAPALAVDAPEQWAVAYALKTLAADCGYTLESCRLAPAREALEAP